MRVFAHGIEHHVHAWGDEGGAPALLLHGYMDAGGTWDLVAPALAAAGYRVLAPDLRGFGETDRAPRGAYYHFPDYVADVAALAPPGPLFVVGHSMGGTVATLLAGAMPERVRALALVEGVGPPDNAPDVAPIRMRRWLDQLASPREEQPVASMEEALDRLRANHARVPDDVLRTRLPHLLRRDAAGALRWAFDPLHRTTAPTPFFAAAYRAFAARVACPVLFVGGGAHGWHPEDEAERLAAFRDARRVEIAGAGHMVHWTRPGELAAALAGFFARA